MGLRHAMKRLIKGADSIRKAKKCICVIRICQKYIGFIFEGHNLFPFSICTFPQK